MPDDWRPKLKRIDEPIADDYWEYTTSRGKQKISRLTVGKPTYYPQEKLWYCPVRIQGYTKPTFEPVFGVGPVDALMNAMTYVKRFSEEIFDFIPGTKPPKRKRRGQSSSSTRQAPQVKPRQPKPSRSAKPSSKKQTRRR